MTKSSRRSGPPKPARKPSPPKSPAGTARSSTAEPDDEGPAFAPLPPPRKSKPRLIIAAILVLAWIGFLLWMALSS